MKINSHSFVKSSLVYFLCISTLSLFIPQESASRDQPRPNPILFETGDFVWPKKPGAFVPYNTGSNNDPEKDKIQWVKERNNYLKKGESSSAKDTLLQERLRKLRDLEYREFIAIYQGDKKTRELDNYSNNSVYVGHVGIIEVDSSKMIWVIEALLNKGVVRKTYADWIKERSDQAVWLGRLKQYTANQRAKIAVEAKKHVGKPYDFWNFNLDDDSGFYCSKLAWLSIYRGLGFSVDGNKDPNRIFWFSPKQFLYLSTIERIHDPGSYALK